MAAGQGLWDSIGNGVTMPLVITLDLDCANSLEVLSTRSVVHPVEVSPSCLHFNLVDVFVLRLLVMWGLPLCMHFRLLISASRQDFANTC